MDKLYKCDPEKNTECKKTICFTNGGECSATTNPEAAITDENGKPIEEPALKVETLKTLRKEFEVNDEIEQAFREGFNEGWKACEVETMQNAINPRKTSKIKITGKLPSLNEYIGACRTNAHVGARMKQDVEQMIMLQLAKMKPITSPVFIHFLWHEQTRRRDKDNVAAGKKFILDAMQKSGKLINDNNNYIKGFADTFEYGGEYGVTIIIEAVTE
ncbi:MAG: hypothetical protein J6J71_01415 [Prevotella sp.]|nr:hypothetical protein [Prevotella sp.]